MVLLGARAIGALDGFASRSTAASLDGPASAAGSLRTRTAASSRPAVAIASGNGIARRGREGVLLSFDLGPFFLRLGDLAPLGSGTWSGETRR